MKKNNYLCEIVTPMFLTGYDGVTPELRAPSFKGMLRYWWRAIHSNLSLKELKKQEGDLFGSVDEQKVQSKLHLNIYDREIEIGTAYLLPHKRERRRKVPTSCLDIETKFQMEIKTYYKKLNYFSSLFELFSFLGSVGKRSRRGYGSFKISEKNGEEYDFLDPLKRIHKLIDDINPGLYGYDDKTITIKENKLDRISEEYPYLKKIHLGIKDTNWKLLVKRIMDYCSRYKDNSLGSAMGFRFASPIYITIIKKEFDVYQLIISELNTALRKNVNLDMIKQEKLIGALKE